MVSQRMKVIDDSQVREERGWESLYIDFEKLVEDFIQEVRMKAKF
jgi:hypothetical protein